MNIPNVLPPAKAEDMNSKQRGERDAAAFPADNLLFMLLFQNMNGKQIEAAGQESEEQQGAQVHPGQEKTKAESILGQNAYLQILQNLFPAGKEADSGLKSTQNLIIDPGGAEQISVFLNDRQVGEQFLDAIKTGLVPNKLLSSEMADFLNMMPAKSWGEDPADLLNVIPNNKPIIFGDKEQASILGQEQANSSPKGLTNVLAGEQAVSLDPKQSSFRNEGNAWDQIADANRLLKQSKAQDGSAVQKSYGLEGITKPDSKESTALNTTELAKYIKTGEQLKELSGKIELGRSTSDGGENVTMRQADSTNKPGQNPLGSLAQSPDFQQEFSGQGNRGEGEKTFSTGHSDWQPIQTAGSNTNGPQDIDVPQSSKAEASGDSGKIWDQVLKMLSKQELNNLREVKEISIHLQPAELGKVHVALRMENGQVHLILNATEQATGALLQNNLQDLRNGLSEMGVACGSFEMGQDYSGEAGTGREFTRPDKGFGPNGQEEELPSFLAASTYLANNGSGSRINLSA